MTELELKETMDQALSISEDYATMRMNEILAEADASTCLMFARYCRNFLVNEDEYDLQDATPEIRRSLAKAYSGLIMLLKTLSDIENFDADVARFNSIIGNLEIDL